MHLLLHDLLEMSSCSFFVVILRLVKVVFFLGVVFFSWALESIFFCFFHSFEFRQQLILGYECATVEGVGPDTGILLNIRNENRNMTAFEENW